MGNAVRKVIRSAMGWARYTPQMAGSMSFGRSSTQGMKVIPCRAMARMVARTALPVV